jgi:hypothetical protein
MANKLRSCLSLRSPHPSYIAKASHCHTETSLKIITHIYTLKAMLVLKRGSTIASQHHLQMGRKQRGHGTVARAEMVPSVFGRPFAHRPDVTTRNAFAAHTNRHVSKSSAVPRITRWYSMAKIEVHISGHLRGRSTGAVRRIVRAVLELEFEYIRFSLFPTVRFWSSGG